jgi:hypothetical protein
VAVHPPELRAQRLQGRVGAGADEEAAQPGQYPLEERRRLYCQGRAGSPGLLDLPRDLPTSDPEHEPQERLSKEIRAWAILIARAALAAATRRDFRQNLARQTTGAINGDADIYGIRVLNSSRARDPRPTSQITPERSPDHGFRRSPDSATIRPEPWTILSSDSGEWPSGKALDSGSGD